MGRLTLHFFSNTTTTSLRIELCQEETVNRNGAERDKSVPSGATPTCGADVLEATVVPLPAASTGVVEVTDRLLIFCF